jgi:hypothetical protein
MTNPIHISWKNHGTDDYIAKAELDYKLKKAGKKGLKKSELVK